MNDHWTDRAGEFLDDDLSPNERSRFESHLVDCESCRAELESLEALRSAARGLPPLDPPRYLWPEIKQRIAKSRDSGDTEVSPAQSRGRRWSGAATIAAALLIAFSIGWLVRPATTRDAALADPSPRFLLLLHQPGALPDRSPHEQEERVQQYRDWAGGIAEEGKLAAGEKLADREGEALGDDGRFELEGADVIGGFFIVAASDYDEALMIARTCPHLDEGWIEIRRIEDV